MEDIRNLKSKVKQYQEVLSNTIAYRAAWKNSLREEITSGLQSLVDATDLVGAIDIKEDIENLEAIVLSLGEAKSGIYQKVNSDLQRHMIKHKGSLVYQQLFNGKILVLINYPFIEGYGQPSPPKTIAIYRPEEIKAPFIIRHMEELVKEMTNWEDYDDDKPEQTHNRIGFNNDYSNID